MMEEAVEVKALIDRSKVKTDQVHRWGDIPNIDELIQITKDAAKVLVSHHSGLKKHMPAFKDNLDKARFSYLKLSKPTKKKIPVKVADKDSNQEKNPENRLIVHKKNTNAFLATIEKMEKTIGTEKFKTPVFWLGITLSICVLTIGAAMIAMPAYLVAGFVCLCAGIIGLIITALTMPSGKKSLMDVTFFNSGKEIAKAFKTALDIDQDIVIRPSSSL